jgi:hypothetical protein
MTARTQRTRKRDFTKEAIMAEALAKRLRAERQLYRLPGRTDKAARAAAAGVISHYRVHTCGDARALLEWAIAGIERRCDEDTIKAAKAVLQFLNTIDGDILPRRSPSGRPRTARVRP